jgi:hypothetical protein
MGIASHSWRQSGRGVELTATSISPLTLYAFMAGYRVKLHFIQTLLLCFIPWITEVTDACVRPAAFHTNLY